MLLLTVYNRPIKSVDLRHSTCGKPCPILLMATACYKGIWLGMVLNALISRLYKFAIF